MQPCRVGRVSSADLIYHSSGRTWPVMRRPTINGVRILSFSVRIWWDGTFVGLVERLVMENHSGRQMLVTTLLCGSCLTTVQSDT